MRCLSVRFVLPLLCLFILQVACGEPGDPHQNQTNQPDPQNQANQDQNEDDPRPPEALSFSVEPADEVTAGEDVNIAVQLLDDGGEPTAVDGVVVTVELNRGEFADGSTTATSTTDGDGRADFELRFESTYDGLVLTATADGELSDASVTTSPFDVVPAAAAPEQSTIEGEDGVGADGEQIAEVTIELFDAYGNPVDGAAPEFTASGEGNDYHDCTPTGDDGVSICGMTSTKPGEKTLEITDPVEVTGETIDFLVPCDPTGYPFGGGAGTADDPHRICTPAHLDQIGGDTDYLDDAFVLTGDIDMEGVEDFNVIGFDDDPEDPSPEVWFSGSFDGQGHELRNLSMDETGEGTFGLFGGLTEAATIENLVIVDVRINASEYNTNVGGLAAINRGHVENVEVVGEFEGFKLVGGIVGKNAGDIFDSRGEGTITGIQEDDFAGLNAGFGGLTGSNTDGGVIENCSADATVSGEDEHVEQLGGLVGLLSEGEIRNSHATGDVDTQFRSAGGLVGYNRDLIANSYATGDVASTDRTAGGLVGFHSDDGEIIDSHAEGSVEGVDHAGGLVGSTSGADIIESYATGDVAGEINVGGLTGKNAFEASIERSFATGSVTGDTLVGGLAGETREEAEIVESYATGDVDGISSVGGFTGKTYHSSVARCYATGDVVGETRVGGFAGFTGQLGSVSHAYSAGAVDGDEDVGGFVGLSTLLNSDTYWDSDTSGLDEPYGGAEPLTTDEFNDEDNFPDWDFDDIWVIDSAPDDSDRPVLQWQDE